MTELKLTVNGTEHTLDVPQSRTLAEVLRYDLGMTGTKIGCGEGHCSICTVLVDGVPTRSCITRAAKVNGKSILTVEGLRALRPSHQQDQREDLKALHPLQEAFRQHHGLQCGYCTPGMIMAGLGLIQDGSGMSDAEVRLGLEGNLCRCTGYQNIVTAIQEAATTLRQPADVQGGSE